MQKTVFIVDDNAINLTVAKETLENKYRVRTFASAQAMFKVLEIEKPNLIVLDIEMPDMDGFGALSKLKKNRLTQDIPVIFLTVLNDVETEVLGFQMGVVDFISKPFSSAVLRNRVKNHLDTDEIIKERVSDIQNLNNAFVHTLAEMGERRDNNTKGHIERVASHIKILVGSMMENGVYVDELSKIDVDLMVSSARLHDVGKIIVPDAILNKPDKLTEEELEIMQKHCEEGDKIINEIMLKTNNSE
jgi:putative two-component system response regulator